MNREPRKLTAADLGTKGAERAALAATLVDWLCAGGVSAGLATLTDLCPDAGGCKDLADMAAK